VRSLGSRCEWTTKTLVDLRRHEPLYALFSVSSPPQIVLYNEDSHVRIGFFMKLSGSCKFLLDCDRYDHIVLTTPPQPSSAFD
jgi:hypothetical protein